MEEEHAGHAAMMQRHGIKHADGAVKGMRHESMAFAMTHGHLDMHVEMAMARRRTMDFDLPVRTLIELAQRQPLDDFKLLTSLPVPVPLCQ